MPLQKELAARIRSQSVTGADLELLEKFRSLARQSKPKDKEKA